ncbi:BppU family phage baseplate upper protein [Limosilactobacillus reuteri]|uniref:BppU family phage baseplate upper protein n=1 Tax=Limosilactobacillus reuteri TaxID=1598 RepID=UPI00234AA8CF|nr:BppU family phage baseplate upper protein [Limosilactobacillus reuteri]MDC6076896.1 BppU family phage baseplate upper protein [Limosilactobacillus reuteri]
METLPKLKQYIPVDLLRSQDETIDIADSFKGRVGDINSYLKLWVYSNGLAQDIRNWRVLFFGTDPEHNDFRVYLTMADDQKLDQQRIGRVTLYFPDNVFQVGGQWEQAYLSFIDPDGNVVSTVNFNLVVQGSNFYARMGQHSKSVIDEFQELVDKLSALVDKDSQEVNAKVAQLKADLDKLGDATKKDFTDWLAKFKQSLTDAMAEINDPKTGIYVRYNQLLDMTKQIQETLKQAQFHDRPFQLKTVADMKAYAPLIAGDIAITQGWDNYDDGHGAYWNIRVKHKDEVPDENNVISLDNGMVAERNSSLLSADSLEDFLYGYTIEIKHNQCEHPLHPAVLYYEDAIGTERDGLGKTSHGFGQTNTKLINCIAEYPDVNTIKVKIPRNFYLDAVPHYKFGAWYLIDGNRTIKVDLGMPINDAKAQAGDGEGESYLSPNTGYFSKPTSPSDLRAVYIDEHTQRLLWRD